MIFAAKSAAPLNRCVSTGTEPGAGIADVFSTIAIADRFGGYGSSPSQTGSDDRPDDRSPECAVTPQGRLLLGYTGAQVNAVVEIKSVGTEQAGSRRTFRIPGGY